MYFKEYLTRASAIFGLAGLGLLGGCDADALESEQLADVARAESRSNIMGCNFARHECEFDCTQLYIINDPEFMMCMGQCRADYFECTADSKSLSFAPPVEPREDTSDTDDDTEADDLAELESAELEPRSTIMGCNFARHACESDCTQLYSTNDPEFMMCMGQCRAEYFECRGTSPRKVDQVDDEEH